MRRMGAVFATVAVLQFSQLALTAAFVRHVSQQAWVLDLHPLPGIVSWMLNWSVPAGFFALVIPLLRRPVAVVADPTGHALAIVPTSLSQPALHIAGSALLVCSSAATIAYGRYFFVTLLGFELDEFVWWL